MNPRPKEKVKHLYIKVSGRQREVLRIMAEMYGYGSYNILIDDLIHAHLNKSRQMMIDTVRELEEGHTEVPVHIAENNYKAFIKYCNALHINPNTLLILLLRQASGKLEKIKNIEKQKL
jgi:hypothetical protein